MQRRVLDQTEEKLSIFQTYKFIKFDKIIVNIRPRSQAVSLKAYIGVLLSIDREMEHIWKVCNVVFWLELMENCQNDRLS